MTDDNTPAHQPSSTANHTQDAPLDPAAAQRAVMRVRDSYDKLRDEVSKVVVGQNDVVEQLLLSMFCGGHAIIVGVPGLAKTLLISTVSQAVNLSFSRIQFTPDLMPSDITGTEMIEEDKATGSRELRFVKGPIFANVILADEVNRTPPKTQAALLEAMQEHQVTVAGVMHRLPEPFFVLATQNPIEQEGTYPLPEAQLDRFMFMITIAYPSEDEEAEIIRRTTSAATAEVLPTLDGADVAEVQKLVRQTPVPEHVIRYALRLVRATRVREHSAENPKPQIVQDYLAWGAGPRASQYLTLAAKAYAVLHGSYHVRPEHVRAIAKPVLRHRIIANFNAEADNINTDDIIDTLLNEITVEGSDSSEQQHMDAVMN